MLFKWGEDSALISVDLSPVLPVPRAIERRIIGEVRSKMEPVLQDYRMTWFDMEDKVHLVPIFPEENVWYISTAQLEADLFHPIDAQCLFKQVVRMTKTISTMYVSGFWSDPAFSNDLLAFSDEPLVLSDDLHALSDESLAPGYANSTIHHSVLEALERYDSLPGDKQTLIRPIVSRIMAYGHTQLTSQSGAKYKELTKSHVSLNTAAIKYFILWKLLEYEAFSKQDQHGGGEVMAFVKLVMAELAAGLAEVRHPFLSYNVKVYSIGGHAANAWYPLMCMAREQCRMVAIWFGLQTLRDAAHTCICHTELHSIVDQLQEDNADEKLANMIKVDEDNADEDNAYEDNAYEDNAEALIHHNATKNTEFHLPAPSRDLIPDSKSSTKLKFKALVKSFKKSFTRRNKKPKVLSMSLETFGETLQSMPLKGQPNIQSINLDRAQRQHLPSLPMDLMSDDVSNISGIHRDYFPPKTLSCRNSRRISKKMAPRIPDQKVAAPVTDQQVMLPFSFSPWILCASLSRQITSPYFRGNPNVEKQVENMAPRLEGNKPRSTILNEASHDSQEVSEVEIRPKLAPTLSSTPRRNQSLNRLLTSYQQLRSDMKTSSRKIRAKDPTWQEPENVTSDLPDVHIDGQNIAWTPRYTHRIYKGDQGTSPDDQGTSPDDRGTSPDDQGTSPDDQGTSPDDRGTSPDDQGMVDWFLAVERRLEQERKQHRAKVHVNHIE